jgi:hypothetical protein
MDGCVYAQKFNQFALDFISKMQKNPILLGRILKIFALINYK